MKKERDDYFRIEIESAGQSRQGRGAIGVLDSDSLQNLLREAVRNRRNAQLAEARKKIAAAGIAPMTMEEIQAEIDADRAERCAKAGG